MDNQQEDSSQLKTHEEIMKLFKALEQVELKVKNPTVFLNEQKEPDAMTQKIELTFYKPEEALEQQKPIEPTTEIPLDQEDTLKQPFWRRKPKPESGSEEKKPRFSFLHKEPHTHQELEVQTEVEQPAPQVEIPRSTFVLQVDSEGNLIGLPLKKQKPKKEEETNAVPEDEAVRGLKGKLKKIGSLFHRKTVSDSESSGGFGEKIKGIFRRKSKE